MIIFLSSFDNKYALCLKFISSFSKTFTESNNYDFYLFNLSVAMHKNSKQKTFIMFTIS